MIHMATLQIVQVLPKVMRMVKLHLLLVILPAIF